MSASDRPLIRNSQFNIGHICTRQVCDSGLDARTAMHWIGLKGEHREYSFGELERESNKAANALASLGLAPGDLLFLYLPKRPEIYFTFLGALKRQLTVGLLFSNFGEDAIRDRIGPCGARAVVTQRSLLNRLLRARKDLPKLEYVLVLDGPCNDPTVLDYAALVSQASDAFTAETTAPETPSLLHYTSGSTGKPKGALHVHSSVLMQNQTTREVLGLRDDDLFWCTADPGWVTGTSYSIIGPWSAGISQLHYAGAYDASRWMQLLGKHPITVWYTAPTALRMLRAEPPELFATPHPHLRSIFSVGEPLNPEVIQWVRQAFGQEVYDTWFQTETGAIMITNRPGLPVRPGSMGTPVRGITAVIVDEQGRPVDSEESGNLCLKPGWPSMFRDYVQNRSAYESKFRNGLYWTGDTAKQDRDGYFWFLGRSDDVINTAGHLVSPFEVESALLERPEVAEAAVVALPDDLLFESVAARVVLRDGYVQSPALEIELKLHVSNRVSTMASPRLLQFAERLPRTRSGKIMRRVVRAEMLGQDPGDLSSMENTDD
jgi:acetyl-CoA synthetase